jgi:hypothetical protein
MGIEITEIGLHCDADGCRNGRLSFASTKEKIENEGWGVDTGGSPYVEEWKVYCPTHKEKE